jgi:hypothetical protein
MTAKPETKKALQQIPEAQKARIKAVAAKQVARADGPPMELQMKDGVLTITFTHAEPDLAHILMMVDLGTCAPHFMAEPGKA